MINKIFTKIIITGSLLFSCNKRLNDSSAEKRYHNNVLNSGAEEKIEVTDKDKKGEYFHHGNKDDNLFDKKYILNEYVNKGAYSKVYSLDNHTKAIKIINIKINDVNVSTGKRGERYRSVCAENGLEVTSENIKKMIMQEFKIGQLDCSAINKSFNLSILDKSKGKKIDIEARILMNYAAGNSVATLEEQNIKLDSGVIKKIFNQIIDSSKYFLKNKIVPYDRHEDNIYIQGYQTLSPKKTYIDFGNFYIFSNNKKINFFKVFLDHHCDALECVAKISHDKDIFTKRLKDYRNYIEQLFKGHKLNNNNDMVNVLDYFFQIN